MHWSLYSRLSLINGTEETGKWFASHVPSKGRYTSCGSIIFSFVLTQVNCYIFLSSRRKDFPQNTSLCRWSVPEMKHINSDQWGNTCSSVNARDSYSTVSWIIPVQHLHGFEFIKAYINFQPEVWKSVQISCCILCS